MSSFFKAPKVPSPPPLPPPPAAPVDIDEEALAEEEKKRIRKGRVRRPTILTGPRGVLEPAGVQRKTLLGQ